MEPVFHIPWDFFSFYHIFFKNEDFSSLLFPFLRIIFMVKYLLIPPTRFSFSYMYYLAVSEIKVFNFTQSLFHLLTLFWG